jgi:hypothetical protein
MTANALRFVERAALAARRLAGYAVDVVVLAAGLAAFQGVLYGLDLNWAVRNPSGWPLHSWVLATVSVPCVLYFAAAPLIMGATAGQRILGLRTVPVHEAFDPIALTLRAIVLLLPFEINHAGLFWGLDAAGAPTPFLWVCVGAAYGLAGLYILSALVDREGCALHDRVGGVRVRSSAPPEPRS